MNYLNKYTEKKTMFCTPNKVIYNVKSKKPNDFIYYVNYNPNPQALQLKKTINL